MIDHMGIPVTDLDKAVAFYTKALAPLGYTLVTQLPQGAGFGVGGHADFWLVVRPFTDKQHVAFRAKGRAEVRAFYDAALAAGGNGNGAPGVRAHYHPSYYAGFAHDPDGHNVEAVCHDPYLD